MIDLKAELQKRYPTQDFSCLFLFLASCPLLPKGSPGTEEHHICPRKQYPEFENLKRFPENGIVLSIADHAYAHLLTELCAPEIKAPSTIFFESHKTACIKGGLSLSFEEHAAAGRKGGPRAASINKANGSSVYSRAVQSKGGSAAQVLHKINKTGPHSKEHQVSAALMRAHKRGYHTGKVNLKCNRCGE